MIKLKLFALITATVLVLSACGGSPAEGTPSADAQPQASSEVALEQSAVKDAPAEIAFSVKGGGDCIIDKELNGTVVIDTEAELKLILRDARINGTTGPAVYVKSCGGLTVVLEGESTLSDSAEYSVEQGELKGAFFSEDNVTFKGDGSLTVTGNRNHAIASDDGIIFESGNVTVESAVKDGIHANDLVEVKGATLSVKAAGGDAIECEAEVKVLGGFLALSSDGDGIKASLNEKGTPLVTVSGGSITVNTKEDGIQSDGKLEISGGTLDITTTGAVVNDNGNQMFPGGGDWQGNSPTRPNGGTRPTRPGFPPDTSMEMPPEGGMTPPGEAVGINEVISSETTAGTSSKGIKAAGTLTVKNGTLSITTTEDAVHGDGDVNIEGGTLNISADDDAFHAESALAIKNGNITVTKCYEGLEGKTVTVDGGVIKITASDDGINSAGGSQTNNRPGNANPENGVTVNGGSIYIISGGDCLDSNGSLTVNGGTVCVEYEGRGGNNALDADGTRLINGGVVVAMGTTDMIESPAASSKQPTAVIFTTVSAGTSYAIVDSDGRAVLCYTASKAASVITVSAAELKVGEGYTLYTGVTPVGEKSCGGLYYGNGASFTGGSAVKSFTLTSTVTQVR